jgi:hypothetical protein
MRLIKLRRLLALVIALIPIGLQVTPAYADTVIRLVPCNFPQHHNTSVVAGSPITLLTGWAMSNRGNLIDFIHAATVTMTVNGQAVTPTASEAVLIDPVDNDTWRVTWTYTTVAPAAGQTTVVTFNLVLAHQVVDHELIEFGLAGPGKPAIIPAGPLYTLLCNVHGT